MDDNKKSEIERILREEYGFSLDTEVEFNGSELLIINNGLSLNELNFGFPSLNGSFSKYGITNFTYKTRDSALHSYDCNEASEGVEYGVDPVSSEDD